MDAPVERTSQEEGDGPREAYEIQTTGAAAAELASALPLLSVSRTESRVVLSGSLSPLELGAALDTVRRLGGRTLAVLRLGAP